jgi:hypothetical protein
LSHSRKDAPKAKTVNSSKVLLEHERSKAELKALMPEDGLAIVAPNDFCLALDRGH